MSSYQVISQKKECNYLIFNIFIVLISAFTVIICCKYNTRDNYNYSQDYESAIISGKLIGGTVYASYPEAVPGLGWVN